VITTDQVIEVIGAIWITLPWLLILLEELHNEF
jgi:hypothetical protein